MGASHVTLITLGVSDLARSTNFYSALGWSKAEQSQDAITFFHGHGGAMLTLYDVRALAEDATLPYEPRSGFASITLASNLPSEAEVDAAFAEALAAGATAVKVPERVFWGGYSGYFADPDGHLWEVAYNPYLPLAPNGTAAH